MAQRKTKRDPLDLHGEIEKSSGIPTPVEDSEATEEPKEVSQTESITDELRKYAIEKTGSDECLEGLDNTQIRRLKQGITRLNLGVHATIIQTCSTKCPSHDRCPLVVIGQAPYNEDCPIEMELFQTHMAQYRQAVMEHAKSTSSEVDIDNDKVIQTLLGEIVESDIIEFRANAMIADLGLVEEIPVLVTEVGGVYTREDENVALKIKDRAKKVRDKNLKQLLATPEMIQRMKGRQRTAEPLERAEETRKKVDAIIEAQIVDSSDEFDKK